MAVRGLVVDEDGLVDQLVNLLNGLEVRFLFDS